MFSERKLRESIAEELSLELEGDLPATDQEIREAWSDAARAAAAASRRARGGSYFSRSYAARQAYWAAGGKASGAKSKNAEYRRNLRLRAEAIGAGANGKKSKSIERFGFGPGGSSLKVTRRSSSGKGQSKSYNKLTPSTKGRLAKVLKRYGLKGSLSNKVFRTADVHKIYQGSRRG